MKLPDLNPAVLIAFGCLTGAIVTALFFPHFPAIPENLATILGSTFGVIGAFLVANWTFQRNLRELRQPITKRYDYCLETIEKAREMVPNLEGKLILVLQKIQEAQPDLRNVTPEMHSPDVKHGAWKTVTKITKDYPIKKFENINKSLNLVHSELFWLRTNRRDSMSPVEIAKVSEILEPLEKAVERLSDIVNSFKRLSQFKDNSTALNDIANT
ncbi:hypothetical protein [Thalassospira xiamenensis]|uniref:Uncharacterized protein n=1 Tax=Thalassospira xiamenensis TaxID=220697 RepID=A0A367X762_9PROT|nr:hypothetical protein [Thalassospira xiamenensis]KZB54314.1 hypothetical protein AUP41_00780 [Thalassospira xiamenensis]RCK48591.1 hypothetical protein TH44_15860 [Thalassospira xiamenensis]